MRYGNVLSSRGSVIPLFKRQIAMGGPVTITLREMTRFLMSLDQAVDTIFAAIRHAARGEIFVPRVPSARVIDVAEVLIGNRPMETTVTGIRPGEKIHEILLSDEESFRTSERAGYYVFSHSCQSSLLRNSNVRSRRSTHQPTRSSSDPNSSNSCHWRTSSILR